jgi:tetratricopeptide (TPR) repeat protein
MEQEKKMTRMAVTLGLVSLTWASWAAELSVLEKDGVTTRSLTGDIVQETTREVVVANDKGEEERIPAFLIESIKYDGQPPELASARSFATQGRYDEALASMMTILDQIDAKESANLDASLRFEILVLKTKKGLKSGGDLPAALEWYQGQQEFLSTSRHYYPSLEWGGRIKLAQRDFTGASELFEKLASVDWPGYRERSQRYLAQVTLEQGKGDEAARLFEDILASTSSGNAVDWEKSLARIGRAKALVLVGKADEAVSLCQQALNDSSLADRPEALAPLRNTLGDALEALGKKKESVLEGYMWVHVLYSSEEMEHARSLFHLTKLLPEIGYPQYGEQMAQILQSKFGQTEWGRKLEMPSS